MRKYLKSLFNYTSHFATKSFVKTFQKICFFSNFSIDILMFLVYDYIDKICERGELLMKKIVTSVLLLMIV